MVDQIQLPPVQAFSGGADFSQLANLGNVYQAAQEKARQQATLAALGQDPAANAQTMIQSGSMPLAELGMRTMMLQRTHDENVREFQAQQAIRQSQEQRAQAEFDVKRRNEALALEASKKFTGMLAGGIPQGGAAPTAAAEPDDAAPAFTAPVAPGIPGAIPPGTPPGIPTSAAPIMPPIAPTPVPVTPETATPATAAPATVATPRPPRNPGDGEDYSIPPIPKLLAALSDPYLPPEQKAIGTEMLKRQFDTLKPTEKIQTLEGLKNRPDLLSVEKELRKAGAPPPLETAYDKTMGETLSTIHSGYLKDAINSGKNKSTLDILEKTMDQPGFYSGTNSNLVQAAQKAAVSLNIVGADTAAPSELFSKVANKLVTDLAGGGGGGLGSGVSNADRDFIGTTVPNLQNTPGGNKAIIGVMRMLEDRKVEVAREVNKYAKEHGGRIDYDLTAHIDKWANEHPLPIDNIPALAQAKALATAATVKVATPEEYNALKSGAHYTDPQGKPRTKP